MKIEELQPSQTGLMGVVAANLQTVHQQLFLSWHLDNQGQLSKVYDLLVDLDVPLVEHQSTIDFMVSMPALMVLKRWVGQLFADEELAESLDVIWENHRLLWQAGRFSFDVTERPLVYAILNITPDSFFDGGQYYQSAQWQKHVDQVVAAGTDVVEVGGQTTRPGFQEISPAEEIRRVVPAVKYLRQHYSNVAIAVDTYKLQVMKTVLAAGADIINDVQAFDSPEKRQLMARSAAGLVTMHSSREREYQHLTMEMRRFFKKNLQQLQNAGINRERIVIDQGIGYSKIADGYQDFAMMNNLDQFNDFHRPILVGISRKGFAKKILGLAKKDRLPATLVAETAMTLRGGRILRVHDVDETKQLITLLDAISHGYWNQELNQES